MRTDPIILTLQFDSVAAAFFARQREAYFPQALNRTPAHLTLFHALPGADVDRLLAEIAPHTHRLPFPLAVDGLMKLGRGVAYRVTSEPLLALRRALAQTWRDDLIRQDRERFRPHVTIQNKVTPEAARATFEMLSSGFEPFAATAEGLQLWHYRGGPWEPLAAVTFGLP